MMMETKMRGRKRVKGRFEPGAYNAAYEYRSPGVSFPTDFMKQEDIAKLSGKVKSYHISELKGDEK